MCSAAATSFLIIQNATRGGLHGKKRWGFEIGLEISLHINKLVVLEVNLLMRFKDN